MELLEISPDLSNEGGDSSDNGLRIFIAVTLLLIAIGIGLAFYMKYQDEIDEYSITEETEEDKTPPLVI